MDERECRGKKNKNQNKSKVERERERAGESESERERERVCVCVCVCVLCVCRREKRARPCNLHRGLRCSLCVGCVIGTNLLTLWVSVCLSRLMTPPITLWSRFVPHFLLWISKGSSLSLRPSQACLFWGPRHLFFFFFVLFFSFGTDRGVKSCARGRFERERERECVCVCVGVA
jgi:hypothetical protein